MEIKNNIITAIIPARFASTRFPGKPLVIIDGITMIQRVYEQAKQSKLLDNIIVATDDKRILEHVKGFGGNALMTASSHQSGTDRCAEIAKKLKETTIIVNIQGDEPFIQPQQIDLLANLLILQKKVDIGTLIKKIETEEQLFNQNIVKAIRDKNGNALYFSRHTIPYLRGIEQKNWLSKHTFYKHIGMYAYRKKTLLKLANLKPSLLENAESLEQLRWLENGFKIATAITELETIGIDTPEDLKKII